MGIQINGQTDTVSTTTVGGKVTIPTADFPSVNSLNVSGVATATTLRSGSGTVSVPSVSFSGDTGTGIWSPGAGQLAISGSGVERLGVDGIGNVNVDSGTFYIDAVNNRVSIGTTIPGSELVVTKSSGNVRLTVQGGTNGDGTIALAGAGTGIGKISAWDQLAFGKSSAGAGDIGTEWGRWDSSGRFLVGTSTARANFNNTTDSAQFQIEGTSATTRRSAIISSESGAGGGAIILAHQRSGTIGGNTVLQSSDTVGGIAFDGSDGTKFVRAALINCEVDGTPGANTMPGRLVFSTTSTTPGASPTERMRISSSGLVSVNSATTSLGTKSPFAITGSGASATIGSLGGSGTGALDTGIPINQGGSGGTVLLLASRNTNNGTATDSAVYIIRFYYDGNNAPTVTYVGGSLNFVTFGTSASNTLTVTNATGGNVNYSWFGNK